jgi:large subunit ribosomal protein L5
MTKIIPAKIKYSERVVPAMMKEFGYRNKMAVPKIEKLVINTGTGKIQKETEKIEEIITTFREISGQKPIRSKAKKAISGFKIREGLEIGVRVTLRGTRMWNFIDRLVNTALPRTRDFQGINLSSVDSKGNLNLGIKEHTIFPEVVLEKVKNIFGLQVVITTSAQSQKEGEFLFRQLGFPLKQENK